MTEFIEQIFSNIFGSNVWLATILISMVPIIELKGAIPFSMSFDVWGSNALTQWEAFTAGIIGTSMIVFLLALIYIPLIKWLKSTRVFRKLGEKVEANINEKRGKVESDIEHKKHRCRAFYLKLSAVFLFVAMPLPFTGVWTGTCLAIALGLNYWTACGTVVGGNIVAGLLITLLSSLFKNSTIILFYILLGLALCLVLYLIIKEIVRRRKVKIPNKINTENLEKK